MKHLHWDTILVEQYQKGFNSGETPVTTLIQAQKQMHTVDRAAQKMFYFNTL